MIYKLKKIIPKYNEILNLSKLIVDIPNVIDNFSLDYDYQLDFARLFLNNSIKRANVFYILENDKKIIGALFAYIPNFISSKENIYNYIYASILNRKLFSKWMIKDLNRIELKILKQELLIEDEYQQNVWKDTVKNNDSGEILFLSVDSNYQGQGLSKQLLKVFFDDLENNNIKKYHLFTTTNCDYEYYEKLGMNCKNKYTLIDGLSLLVYEKKI